jgi:hypothetical protein
VGAGAWALSNAASEAVAIVASAAEETWHRIGIASCFLKWRTRLHDSRLRHSSIVNLQQSINLPICQSPIGA